MKVIAIGTMKGGTGKTTMAFNLAGILAERGKVLLWDIDPQCNLNQSVGLDLNTRDGYTTKDIFEDLELAPENVVVDLGDNMYIVPGSIDLTVTEAVLPSRAGKEMVLKHYLEDNRAYFEQFDYIIFDTNPSMSNVNQNGFVAADSIILISDVSLHSIRGADLFLYLWRDIRRSLRLPDTVRALVLNNYDVRTNLAKQLTAYCMEQDHLAPLLVSPVIPARVAMKNTSITHTPISKAAPDSDITQIMRDVVADLEQKGAF